MTVANDTTSLTYPELLKYGVWLEGRNVTIYSRDSRLVGASFDVVIKSALAEETSWADFYVITINILTGVEKVDNDLVQGRPRFDSAKMGLANSLLFYEN